MHIHDTLHSKTLLTLLQECNTGIETQKAVNAPSLEVLKARLNGDLSNKIFTNLQIKMYFTQLQLLSSLGHQIEEKN